MQQDVGFLSYYCMWGLWVSEILLNHLQDPREDANKILFWSSDSPTVLRFINVFCHLYPYVKSLSLVSPFHATYLLPLCGKDPFSLRVSHHYLVSSADLLPNDPLPFPFTENCPVPADFQPFLPVLAAGTHLCPEPLITLPSRCTSPAPSALLPQCSPSKPPTRHSSCMEKSLLTH